MRRLSGRVQRLPKIVGNERLVGQCVCVCVCVRVCVSLSQQWPPSHGTCVFTWHSLVRELAYTARRMPADEALKMGLVSAVLTDRAALYERALNTAKRIAGAR